MSNLAAIGLCGETEEQTEDTLRRVFERAGPVPELGAESSGHAWFQDPSGAAVAVHLGRRGRVDCITPFFVAPDGGARWRVRTTAPHIDRECRHCSGADCDVLDGEPAEMVTRATVQWALFQPYRRWLGQPREFDLKVVGFASGLSLCADAAELELAQAKRFGERDVTQPLEPGKPVRLADQALLPYGMFQSAGDLGQTARALLTGSVESMATRTSVLTGQAFVHVRLRTLGGSLDVVAPIAALEDASAAPAIALADVWLVGRPCEPPPPPRPGGFWQRITGRA